MKYKLIILILIISACSETINNDRFTLRNNIEGSGKSTFSKDFNIFKREGIKLIDSDTLEFPFFQIMDLNDSCIEVVLHKPKIKERMTIPKGNQLMYTFHNITDGPRHIYYKIFKDRIITYGYEERLDEIINSNVDSICLYTLLPQEVQVIKQDSIYTYFSDCFTSLDINTIITKGDFLKVAIYPFQIEPKESCDRSTVMYFDDIGHFCHFYNDRGNKESLSKEHPGMGLYNYKKEFKYWREYFNLQW